MPEFETHKALTIERDQAKVIFSRLELGPIITDVKAWKDRTNEVQHGGIHWAEVHADGKVDRLKSAHRQAFAPWDGNAFVEHLKGADPRSPAGIFIESLVEDQFLQSFAVSGNSQNSVWHALEVTVKTTLNWHEATVDQNLAIS